MRGDPRSYRSIRLSVDQSLEVGFSTLTSGLPVIGPEQGGWLVVFGGNLPRRGGSWQKILGSYPGTSSSPPACS